MVSTRSQTMEDVENLLDRRAAEQDKFPRSDAAEVGRKLAAWLRSASPDERHIMAAGWNRDNGAEPLIWIARQPDCDKATALLIYRGFDPNDYAKENFIPPDKNPSWETLGCDRAAYRRQQARRLLPPRRNSVV